MGRLVGADEVATAIAYLASPLAGRPPERCSPWTAGWPGSGSVEPDSRTDEVMLAG